MLEVTEVKRFCTDVVAAVPGINSYIMIVGEKHLAKHIGNKRIEEFPVLVALYPSANGSGSNLDNLQYANELDFFVLQKIPDYSARTYQKEEDDYIDTQALTKAVIQFIKDNQGKPGYCTWLGKINPNTIGIDPEYNYHDCDGWSFSFGLMTT